MVAVKRKTNGWKFRTIFTSSWSSAASCKSKKAEQGSTRELSGERNRCWPQPLSVGNGRTQHINKVSLLSRPPLKGSPRTFGKRDSTSARSPITSMLAPAALKRNKPSPSPLKKRLRHSLSRSKLKKKRHGTVARIVARESQQLAFLRPSGREMPSHKGSFVQHQCSVIVFHPTRSLPCFRNGRRSRDCAFSRERYLKFAAGERRTKRARCPEWPIQMSSTARESASRQRC